MQEVRCSLLRDSALRIHSTEMSNSDARTALRAAHDLIADTAPLQAQHLQHMTSHTYLRTGYYHEALMSNIVAVGSLFGNTAGLQPFLQLNGCLRKNQTRQLEY